MIEIQLSTEVNAVNERVWATLWEDITFRNWASIIDEGTFPPLLPNCCGCMHMK